MSDNGNAVWCGRVPDGSLRQNAGGQWLHRLGPGDRSLDDEHPSHRRGRDRTAQSEPLPKSNFDWSGLMQYCIDRPDISEKQGILARQLGVSAAALARLQVGWSDKHSAWLIPERNGAGKIVGIVRRYPNGKKRQMARSRRGLTFTPDWENDPGPVLLVEGASDVAAVLTAGGCAVGRPSNSGGVPLLCELLCRLPIGRELICVGENDQKPHDDLKPSVRLSHSPKCEGCLKCWPGHAAFDVAQRLAEALQRPVSVGFPPEEAKDVRDLLHKMEGVT